MLNKHDRMRTEIVTEIAIEESALIQRRKKRHLKLAAPWVGVLAAAVWVGEYVIRKRSAITGMAIGATATTAVAAYVCVDPGTPGREARPKPTIQAPAPQRPGRTPPPTRPEPVPPLPLDVSTPMPSPSRLRAPPSSRPPPVAIHLPRMRPPTPPVVALPKPPSVTVPPIPPAETQPGEDCFIRVQLGELLRICLTL